MENASRINYLGQIDHFDYDESSSKMVVTGVVRAPGVLTYRNLDGSTRKELVHPSLLRRMDAKSGMPLAAQMAGLTTTNDHPPKMLENRPERVDMYGVGDVRNDGIMVYKDGRTEVKFEVADPVAQDDIRSGRKRGLSLGYTCATVKKDGRYGNESFDHIQEEPFRADHLAICAIPRSSGSVITKFDHFDQVDAEYSDFAIEVLDPSPSPTSKPKKDTAMATIQMGTATYEVDPAVASAFNQFHTDMKKKHDEELEDKYSEEDMEEAKTDAEYQKTRADSLEAAVLELSENQHNDADDADVATEIAQRLDTWQQSMTLLGQASARLDSNMEVMEVKEDSFGYDPKLTCEEIKRQALLKFDSKLDLKDKSSDYVDARFDAAIAQANQPTQSRMDSTQPLRKALAQTGSSGGDRMDAKAIRAQRMRRDQALSRLPVGTALENR